MARTIAEIKAQIAETFISQDAIRSAYGISGKQSFDQTFSPVSLESLMFYVVASCIWLLEKMFDRHAQEVDSKIETLRPHTRRWYASKAKEYMKGHSLIMEGGIEVADHYDTSGMTEADIDKARIVKYAVANEDERTGALFIKVAKRDSDGNPTPLDTAAGNDELAGFKHYISQIKDAGVAVNVINSPADKIKVEVIVVYDPVLLSPRDITGAEDANKCRRMTLMRDGKDVIREAVLKVVSQLPFNGEYRNSDLMAALQAVEGVEVVDIVSVQAAPGDSSTYSPVVGYRRPYSGYYNLAELTVKGREYKVAE